MSVSHFSRDPRPGSPFSRGPRPAADVPAGEHHTAAVLEPSPSGRRFGEVLLEEGMITAAELDTALRVQAALRAYVPLGQVLLANKFITRKQLNSLLHRHKKRSRLGEILVRARTITSQQLHEALALQRRTPMPVGQALIQLGYLTEWTMRDALCTQLHINFFDVDPIVIDRGLTRLISERFALRHLVLPLFRAGDTLVVVMDDPSQAEFIERLQFDLGLHVEVVTTLTQKLTAAMARLYGSAPTPDVDVFARRNIVVGSIRDPFVAELAEKTLRGVSVVAHAW